MEKIKKGYVVQILLKEQLVPIRVYVRDEAFIDKLLTGKNQIQIIWNEKGEIMWHYMAKVLNEKQQNYLKDKGYEANGEHVAYESREYSSLVSAWIDFELDRAYAIYPCEWDIDQKLIDETQMVLNNAKRDLEELKKLGDEK